jgi:serine protease Do
MRAAILEVWQMNTRRWFRMIGMGAVLALLMVGCSGGGADETTTTGAAAQDTTTTAAAAGNAVDRLEDVRGAVVRIVAEGSFVDPDLGAQYNAAGSGSGFFIDPSGIAVTNNHVVTGAAFLEVYVDGEDEPRNARILGVSECSDLAVIDVDGDGFSYLDLYDGPLVAGTDIYAAGFPLGNEEYTLLDGIISKEDADGATDWSSVDAVIEHSADTLPGSSGGPIVTKDGKVVAVNYAGDGAGQSYGIGLDEINKVLPQLRAGEDVTSIGVNGQAVIGDYLAGIWVASVASGSPAALVGIEAGDLITLLEGLIPATDGTMEDYCDILRSHQPGDPLSVEVYRPSDDIFLEGTINTDLVLTPSFSFETTLQDEVADDGGTAAPAGYDSYETVTDDSGIITMDVPAAWADRRGTPWSFEGGDDVGVAVTAATDIDGWSGGWATPGVFFGASSSITGSFTVDSLLDYEWFGDSCTYEGRQGYEDALYTGEYDVYSGCGGEDMLYVQVVAEPADGAFLMLLQVVAIDDSDLEALDTILATFVADEAALLSAGFGGGGTTATTVAGGSPGTVTLATLQPGHCFDDSSLPGDTVDADFAVELVDCGDPHDNETYVRYGFTAGAGAAYPGDDALATELESVCYDSFPGYVGVDYLDSSLLYFFFYPVEEAWQSGDRLGLCMLYDMNYEKLIGSAYQSGW